MKRILTLILACLLLAGCASDPIPETTVPVTIPETTVPETEAPTLPPETLPPDPIAELMSSMALEDWVGQLFLVGTGNPDHIKEYNLGGLLLFASDFADPNSADTIARWQASAAIPLLIATDEEGGTVTRVSRQSHYRESKFPSPRDLYAQGGIDWVLSQEAEKSDLLRFVGVNVNLAPVCDITTDPAAFMYKRSLGLDPDTTGAVIAQMVQTMTSHGIGSALKHFPGYGDNVDTHVGIAVDSRSLEALEGRDLIPFRYGIEAGCGAILVSHTVVEAIDPEFPASLSPAVHRYLREEMGFDGVIITDDLNMQAISDRYGAGEAAVQAVLSGNDILCCTAYEAQYEAVLAAVLEGRIPFDTLKSAVRNVLEWKANLGLI